LAPLQDRANVASSMKNGDHGHKLRFSPVNYEVGKNRPEQQCFIARKVLPMVTLAGHLCQASKRADESADDVACNTRAGFGNEISTNPHKVALRLGVRM
jgi:hypothetical protein